MSADSSPESIRYLSGYTVRYAYVKNGDVVEQLRALDSGVASGGGPEAFLSDLIAQHSQDSVLLLSKAKRTAGPTRGTSRTAHYTAASGRVMARAFAWGAPWRIAIRTFLWKPDRILCGGGKSLLWLSVLVAKLRGIPVVCSRHAGLIPRSGVNGLISLLDRASIRACDAVVCHGPFLRQQVRELGVPQDRIFEFDVDLRTFVASGARATAPPALANFKARFDAIVMFLGRMQSDKGVLDLLEAFCSAIPSCPISVGLVYVGQGADFGRVETAIRERRIENKVLLLGKVAHEAIPAVLRCADLVATPTRPPLSEGRCMVMLESLVLGVPVVAPDYAAFPYAIQHGTNGLLFETGNKQALGECIARILGDASLRRRLEQGALQTGRELLVASRSFASAVDLAFERTQMSPP